MQDCYLVEEHPEDYSLDSHPIALFYEQSLLLLKALIFACVFILASIFGFVFLFCLYLFLFVYYRYFWKIV